MLFADYAKKISAESAEILRFLRIPERSEVYLEGTTEKFNLGISNYNIGMTFAEQDLKSNWGKYIEQFFKEVRDRN